MNRIELDSARQPIVPSCILANKSGQKLGVVLIDEQTLTVKVSLEDGCILLSEMSCDVHKYINTFKNPLWDKIKNFKLLYIPIYVPHIKARGIWYEITVTIDENDDTVKHLTGTLAQYAELNQSKNFEVEIRTEEDIDRDDYEDTVFYNPTNPDASIVDRILHDKARHYSVFHVDDTLKNLKRTFSFDGDEVIGCLKELAQEVDCIIIFGESDEEDNTFKRTISFYDAKDYCPECKKRGDFSEGCTNPDCTHSQKIIPRYGTDSGIFINKDNLGENINLSVDTDNIKNCFRLTAGDDDMTAAVVNCNPSGSRYIWHFTNEMKEDMSPELREKINAYEQEYNDYRYSYIIGALTENDIADYNDLITKYQSYSKEDLINFEYPLKGYSNLTLAYYYMLYLETFLENTMMPYSPDVADTSAYEQLSLYKETTIGVRSLASINETTSANEVKESVKLYVDTSRYSVEIETISYENDIWTGTITVTSLTDEEDMATEERVLNFTEATGDYIRGHVDKFIKKKEALLSGIVNLLKADDTTFAEEIPKYNLISLSNISQTINAVLNILDEAGITETTQPDVYEEIYLPYTRKADMVSSEISIRERETETLSTLIDKINTEQKKINKALNLEAYLGETLWLELLAFRREDEQENNNFISDGLTDTELIQNAMDFFERADEDITKQCESQYTITCTLKDLLLLSPETYASKINDFDVGNWLRIEVDDKIYKLRLTSYQFNFGALNNIQVEFSDVKTSRDFFSTFASMQRTTRNNKKTLSDVSKKIDATESTVNIVNQISQITQGGNNQYIATVRYDSIMVNDDESLEEYLSKISKEVNGSLLITLTNEFQAITTDEDGEGGDYSDCNTDVLLYYGMTDITNDPSVTWNVSIPSNVTGQWNGETHSIIITNVTGNYGIIEVKAIYQGLEVRKNFAVKKIKAASSPITVEITSSAGNIFKNRGIHTILTATVRRGNKDISDTITNYHWVKYDQDGNLDPDWSRLNTRTITLSPADLWSKAIFTCEVTTD